MATLQKIWNEFLNVVFPAVCVGCGRRGREPICEGCFAKIEINNSFFCPECNRRLPGVENFCHPEAKFVLAAASSYENRAVREVIHALKYNRAKTALEPLAEITKKYSEKVFENCKLEIENFVIVPLPLHPQKERERGFNQAMLIAQTAARVLSRGIVPEFEPPQIETNNLVRTKNTRSQTKMKDTEERERNVSGAFSLKKPENVAGKNIFLVDDVFTSGATMKEAVKVLKQAGARKIIGFVIAKA